jgi:hypothetical protein
VALKQPKGTGDPALRAWEDEVYQGSGGGSGMGVWSRPDAHMVQYRLYCQHRLYHGSHRCARIGGIGARPTTGAIAISIVQGTPLDPAGPMDRPERP